jgi:hypothetical protein
MDKLIAIKEFKEHNRRLFESHLNEYEFLGIFPEDEYKSCILCEYVLDIKDVSSTYICEHCPIMEQYGKNCTELGFYFYKRSKPEWFALVENLKEE